VGKECIEQKYDLGFLYVNDVALGSTVTHLKMSDNMADSVCLQCQVLS
jgi:hypothetical protein